MNVPELKKKISSMSIWKKNGQRAPHKPLLILYALGQFQNTARVELPYEEVREKLKQLLIEFGPARKSYHPEEPFVRLVGDGLWQLSSAVDKKNFSDRQLLNDRIAGGFTPEVIALLKGDGQLVQELAAQLLNEHFPDTMHEDILEETGLAFHSFQKKQRDHHFRERVLRAYEYSCAVCGFNVRLGRNLVAIEAAHIKWHQVGGPDCEENGIALCSLHHKLFDRGVFTISADDRLLVSEDAHGTNGFEEWLMRFHGETLRKPIRPDYAPNDSFKHWHVREVFKGTARYL